MGHQIHPRNTHAVHIHPGQVQLYRHHEGEALIDLENGNFLPFQRLTSRRRPYFNGDTAVGMAMVDTMFVVKWAGPPLGGQMPWATASARALERASSEG